MFVYRIELIDKMGYTAEERHFVKKERAIREFNKWINKLRAGNDTATDEEMQDNGVADKNFCDDPSGDNRVIKKCMVGIWQKTGYEYVEWDINPHHLQLKEIEVIK